MSRIKTVLKNGSVAVCCMALTWTANALTPKEFESIKTKADQGDASSLCKLGCCYQSGDCVVPDAAKSAELIRRAADKGCIRAMAICFEKGYGVGLDFKQALDLFQNAADAGDTEAMMDFLRYYQELYSGKMLLDGVVYETKKEFTYLKRASDCGNTDAIKTLASYYKHGKLGLERNEAKADELTRKRAVLLLDKAEQGDASAMVDLASCYCSGEGVDADKLEGLKWDLKAAEGGNVSGMMRCAFAHAIGEVVGKDVAMAKRWWNSAEEYLEKAASQGDVRSMGRLAGLLRCKTNLSLSEKWSSLYLAQKTKYAELRAKAGCLDVMQELVSDYHYGSNGLAVDESKSWKWKLRCQTHLRLSAESGNVAAMKALGDAYSFGRDWLPIGKDESQAIVWWRKAAEAGDRESMRNIARAYRFGKGVEKSEQNAFKWSMKAAAAGDVEEMRRAAEAYAHGWGVKESQQKAFELYMKAAEAGDAKSMFRVASAYQCGLGVEKSEHSAFEWYIKAYEAGNKYALLKLGECYENGIGTDVDLSKAMECYRKSKDAGCSFAAEKIERCQNKLRRQ